MFFYSKMEIIKMSTSEEQRMKIIDNQERLENKMNAMFEKMDNQMSVMSDKVSVICLSIERLVVLSQESAKNNKRESEQHKNDIADNKSRIRELESHKVKQETLNKFMYAIATASLTALVGVVVEFATR